MIVYKPVSVPRNAFRFCRWSMAALIWVGVLLHSQPLVGICAGVMALSALLTVSRAPMVMLYSCTFNRLFPSPMVVLDETGMRMAHSVAAIALTVPLLMVHYGEGNLVATGWRWLFYVALFKTAGALGFCPASRMFTCMLGGGSCCGIFKRAKSNE